MDGWIACMWDDDVGCQRRADIGNGEVDDWLAAQSSGRNLFITLGERGRASVRDGLRGMRGA